MELPIHRRRRGNGASAPTNSTYIAFRILEGSETGPMNDRRNEVMPPASSFGSPVADELDGFAAREYQKLRALAHTLRRRVAALRAVPGTDSLVHETYVSLKSAGHESWHDRTHFIAVAALQLRHLLVDHARAEQARKRGGDQVCVSLDENANLAPKPALDVLVLDEALRRLARHHARQHRVAELRLFGGLSVAEIAAVIEVSERTIKEDWRQAREFLARGLRNDFGGDP
jgi:RNA polymerase sigma-70 factor (ECF subfamily)